LENTTKEKINIFWFRRDLRLEDNVGLYNALQLGNVLPIFIFDTEILDKLPKNDARVNFIYQQLQKINDTLKSNQSSLAIFKGKPIEVFSQLIKSYQINAVYTNHDYEPYAISRDHEIKDFLDTHQVQLNTYKDQVIFERNEIVKDDGLPYKVYTPYSKKWISKLKTQAPISVTSEKKYNSFISHSYSFLSLESIGFETNSISVTDYIVTPELIYNYEAIRNFPSQDSTSKLGPHLRFGTISIRNIVRVASQQQNNTFLKELIWREFFMQILWHYPQTVTKSFKPKYNAIKWRNNKNEFKAWCKGKTGYPLVDAGMRELNTTGFMHNRVRMLVGSFLCKHLLIDWRWGEAYFSKQLLDYELSSNIGNWQWVAGCGVDAAPYFRIFNPTTQIEKFDKQHQYIKKWVPEYQELTYITSKIVDHKMARERCLKTFKDALNNKN